MTYSKFDALNKGLRLGIYNGIFMWSLQGVGSLHMWHAEGGFKVLKGLRVNRCFDLLFTTASFGWTSWSLTVDPYGVL